MSGTFQAGSFQPPINYGIQSPAIGRGGPGMPLDSYARHMNSWVPGWAGTIFSLALPYPYGSASSLKTVPQAPNLWTAYPLPFSGVVKQPSTVPVF